MVISVISSPGFPEGIALEWLQKSGLLDEDNHFLVALDGAGKRIVTELLRRRKDFTLFLPSTIRFCRAADLPLIQFVKKRGECVEGADVFPRGKEFFSRNAFMIDNSDKLVAFYDGKKGCLEKTIKLAKKKRKKTEIIEMNDNKKGKENVS